MNSRGQFRTRSKEYINKAPLADFVESWPQGRPKKTPEKKHRREHKNDKTQNTKKERRREKRKRQQKTRETPRDPKGHQKTAQHTKQHTTPRNTPKSTPHHTGARPRKTNPTQLANFCGIANPNQRIEVRKCRPFRARNHFFGLTLCFFFLGRVLVSCRLPGRVLVSRRVLPARRPGLLLGFSN